MNCADASARLVELLDNRIDETEKALVKEHLAECPQCRMNFQRLKAAHAFLETEIPETTAMISAPEMLALRIKHQLLHRSEHWWQRPAGKRAWAAAAGVAVLLTASMAFSIFNNNPSDTIPSQQNSQITDAGQAPELIKSAAVTPFVEKVDELTSEDDQWPDIQVRRAPQSAPQVQIPVLVKPVGYDRDM